MKKWLFNPFVYIAGAPALLIGLAFMIVTAVICIYSHTHFHGLSQIGSKDAAAWTYFFEAFTCWIVPVIIFYAAGLTFSRSSIRFIDVAGTFALARWVMLFVALAGFGMHLPDMADHSAAEIMKSFSPSFLVLTFVSLLSLVWMIALLYNAFAISCNIRKNAAVIFICCLLVTEILVRLIIHFVKQ